MSFLSSGSKEVKMANKKSSKQLSVALRDVSDHPDAYQVKLSPAGDLSESTQNQLFNMFEENMYDLYVNSHFGWKPTEKRSELFDPLSRFILISPLANPDEISGYSMFRFEYEDEANILYCYELQVAQSQQSKGLGKYLVALLAAVGRRFKMDMITLTVLNANTRAIKFYATSGFGLDEGSPGNNESDDELNIEDYQIWSKSLAST